MTQTTVTCPDCGYSARMDDNRIPPGGARVKCPRCKKPFKLSPKSPTSAAAAQPAATPALKESSATKPEAPVTTPAAARAATPAPEPRSEAMRGRDQRKHRRVAFAVDVLVNRASLMKAIDLSEGGVYVHTGRSFNPGSVVDVELPLGSRKITVKGSVQHNQTGIGMGIMFVDLSESQRGAIREYLQNATAGAQAFGPARKKILLIDEDSMKRRMSKSKLMLEGYYVVDFEDAMEAIRVMEQEAPDLVILDPIMRKMDGCKVVAIVRESPRLREVPIVAYSSKGSDEIMSQAMAVGANEFHLKMTTPPAKLAEIVKRILPIRGR